MKGSKWLAVLLCLFLSAKAIAQQPWQLWFTYNHAARLSDKWGYTFDLNFRTRGLFPAAAALTAARVGGSYQLKSGARIVAGYAWFGSHVRNREQAFLHENRLYEQIQWGGTKKGLQISQRVRLEQRFREFFLDDTTSRSWVAFTFRARYLIQVQGPLARKKGTDEVNWSWQAANEIFLHAGQGLNGNYFDQNRTLAGVVYSPDRKIDIACLYQLIIQRQPIAQQTQLVNSVRFTFFHKLDFRNSARRRDRLPVVPSMPD
jgi:hypothetical protein